jgi:hypothetical protein
MSAMQGSEPSPTATTRAGCDGQISPTLSRRAGVNLRRLPVTSADRGLGWIAFQHGGHSCRRPGWPAEVCDAASLTKGHLTRLVFRPPTGFLRGQACGFPASSQARGPKKTPVAVPLWGAHSRR